MVFWCLQFPPKKEQKQIALRYHSSKVEFLRSFFGGNRNPFEINWPLPLMRNWVCHLYCCHKKSHNIWLLWGVTTINVFWAPSYFPRFLLGAFSFFVVNLSHYYYQTPKFSHSSLFSPFSYIIFAKNQKV